MDERKATKEEKRLAALVRDFVATGSMTMRQLTKSVAEIFGPERAGEIAATEVTRAYAIKSKSEVDELRAVGLKLIDVWHTANDEEVCAECRQREGNAPGDGILVEYPPAHPGCRCWVGHRVASYA
jgi:hypothetical protein